MRRWGEPATWVGLLGIAAVGGYTWVVGRAASMPEYDAWGGLVVVPMLILASILMILRAGRRDPDPRFLTLLAWAFALKCCATVARYLMAFVLYDGVADATVYDLEGARLAEHYRVGDFGADLGRPLIGTGFIRAFTGAIYAVTGPSIFVAYAVYAWLGFWGLYFFYRAFRVAVPRGDAIRYAVLVLFLPSMLFWPSGLGKEAFVTFGLGLVAYGSARLLMDERGGLIPLVLGLLATGLVRPHVTAAVFAGLGAAYLLRRRGKPASELTPITYLVGASVIAVGAFVTVTQAADFLDVGDVSVSNVDAAISDTADRTSQGGSEFDAEGVGHLLDLPVAVVSVLFRPFLFEAGNPQMLVAGVEGTVLLVIAARSWRSLRHVPGRLRREPYLLMCLVYALIFIYAFSNFSNFGILVRERVQVLPFVLAFLALRPPDEPDQPTIETNDLREVTT